MAKKNNLIDFWHFRHSCGHAVYWNDIAIGDSVSAAPCPWCGAENGDKVPESELMVHDPKANLLGFRERLPDGTIPWPKELAKSSGRVALRHRADNSCCDAPKNN